MRTARRWWHGPDRLRVLAVDEPSAAVVRRIFDEYLAGMGDRAIANGLNRDGIRCPSARRPGQNRHRLADGWQGSTVRSILENPRYTGYARSSAGGPSTRC
jgi:Recombinase